eukprot:jgi/Psemu1/1030/gm1.1030_g
MVRAANEKSPAFYAALTACFAIGAWCIYHDLGVIAFVLAVFVGIFGFGLRDKFSNETTASAYSVFNKDGRAIVGGFTSSQFENQLRGPLHAAANRQNEKNSNDDPLSGPIAESRGSNNRTTTTDVSDAERTKRRRAAAEAAERRWNNTKVE